MSELDKLNEEANRLLIEKDERIVELETTDQSIREELKGLVWLEKVNIKQRERIAELEAANENLFKLKQATVVADVALKKRLAEAKRLIDRIGTIEAGTIDFIVEAQTWRKGSL
jgi:hypothetical protein